MHLEAIFKCGSSLQVDNFKRVFLSVFIFYAVRACKHFQKLAVLIEKSNTNFLKCSFSSLQCMN